jgi:hypothetical protein
MYTRIAGAPRQDHPPGAGPVAPVTRVLGVGRQALSNQPATPRDDEGKLVELRATPLEVALHLLARRHRAAG